MRITWIFMILNAMAAFSNAVAGNLAIAVFNAVVCLSLVFILRTRS